jgi:glutamine amidotransferase
VIVVIDCDMGNVGSIVNMLKKAGHSATISRDPREIAQADRLILPGVGSFDAGMANIRELGLLGVLEEKVMRERTPVLGICLGMQLLGRGSAEGRLPGLGWLPGQVVRFSKPGLRVPHMGWNTVHPARAHWLFEGLPEEMRFYFVHSYYMVCNDGAEPLATARYGDDICVAVASEHILGVQFHPEKSHRFGMMLLRNFASHS